MRKIVLEIKIMAYAQIFEAAPDRFAKQPNNFPSARKYKMTVTSEEPAANQETQG
jgi:hypothetical protein